MACYVFRNLSMPDAVSQNKKLSKQTICVSECWSCWKVKKKRKRKKERGECLCQGFMVLHLCSRANTSLSTATDSCFHFLMCPNLDHWKNCQHSEKHTKITQPAAKGVVGGREKAEQLRRNGICSICMMLAPLGPFLSNPQHKRQHLTYLLKDDNLTLISFGCNSVRITDMRIYYTCNGDWQMYPSVELSDSSAYTAILPSQGVYLSTNFGRLKV